MLRERIITALCLVFLLLVDLLWLPFSGFVGFMGLVFTLAAWEWANLAGIQSHGGRAIYALAFAALFAGISLSGVASSGWLCVFLAVAVTGWIPALWAVFHYPENKNWHQPRVLAFMGLWLLLPAFVSLLVLQPLVNKSGLIWLVIGSVAAADIGAYFVGRRLGKHKLAPAVSPGKTWEGFWGGAFANLILAAVVGWYAQLSIGEFFCFVLLMVLTASASVLGDLFESMIKRERGIKDSGKLLPGHGGVLDRIDGWMAAFPAFTLFYLLSRF